MSFYCTWFLVIFWSIFIIWSENSCEGMLFYRWGPCRGSLCATFNYTLIFLLTIHSIVEMICWQVLFHGKVTMTVRSIRWNIRCWMKWTMRKPRLLCVKNCFSAFIGRSGRLLVQLQCCSWNSQGRMNDEMFIRWNGTSSDENPKSNIWWVQILMWSNNISMATVHLLCKSNRQGCLTTTECQTNRVGNALVCYVLRCNALACSSRLVLTVARVYFHECYGSFVCVWSGQFSLHDVLFSIKCLSVLFIVRTFETGRPLLWFG